MFAGKTSAGSNQARTTRRFVFFVLSALLASACGSTVPGAARLATATDPAGDSLSLPQDPSSEPISGVDGGSSPSVDDGTQSLASPSLSPGNPSGSHSSARGVTDSEIKIGAIRIENGAEANRALGIDVSPGDPDLYDRIMLNHINSTGGVAGRKVKMVYYTVDANNRPPTAVYEQEACELWTRDDPVFVAIAGGTDNFKACMAKGGVPLLSSSPLTSSDDQSFRQFPSVLAVNAINLTRRAKVYAEGLVAQKFFGPRSKIGLLTFDEPAVHRAVDGTLKPTLAAHGYRLAAEHYFNFPESQAELGQEAASFSGVVLRFKSEGIDRVLIMDLTGGGVMIFFGRNAQAQDYHPRYGLESSSFPQFQIDFETVDPSQFRGAVGVGWTPLSDVAPPKPFGPGYARCMKIMEDGGADFGGNDNARGIGMLTCDSYFFLRAATEAGLPSITASSFVTGAESLADSFPTAATTAVRLGRGRHDGLSALRNFAFFDDCTCFKYSSGLRPVE